MGCGVVAGVCPRGRSGLAAAGGVVAGKANVFGLVRVVVAVSVVCACRGCRGHGRVIVVVSVACACRDCYGAMGRSPALLGAAARTVVQALATYKNKNAHATTGAAATDKIRSMSKG